MVKRTIEMELEYQPYIDQAPVTVKQLFNQAASSDEVTINTWREQWISQTRENHKNYGPFKDRSIGSLYGECQNQPIIVVGSGPSLKHNAKDLVKITKDEKTGIETTVKHTNGVRIISCLHNFHFLEDLGAPADYYVSLDAGVITKEEVYSCGKRTPEEYWALTKNRTLLAWVGSHPELLKAWQGRILFFHSPINDEEYQKKTEDLETFICHASTGGNVLGAATYIAKAFLGANPLAFIGADFSFSYDKKFHGWNSDYDKDIGTVNRAIDVFGNAVATWPSYYNFKCWFDHVVLKVPGLWFNCTEGGIFGAYRDGNIAQLRQLALIDFIRMWGINALVKDQAINPENAIKQLLF